MDYEEPETVEFSIKDLPLLDLPQEEPINPPRFTEEQIAEMIVRQIKKDLDRWVRNLHNAVSKALRGSVIRFK